MKKHKLFLVLFFLILSIKGYGTQIRGTQIKDHDVDSVQLKLDGISGLNIKWIRDSIFVKLGSNYGVSSWIRIGDTIFIDSTCNVDTVISIDTIYNYDSTFIYDTTFKYDSLFVYDTTFFYDSTWIFDTTFLYDSSFVYDSTFSYDTTVIYDTINVDSCNISANSYLLQGKDTIWIKEQGGGSVDSIYFGWSTNNGTEGWKKSGDSIIIDTTSAGGGIDTTANYHWTGVHKFDGQVSFQDTIKYYFSPTDDSTFIEQFRSGKKLMRRIKDVR